MNSNIETEATVPILDPEIYNTEGVGPATAKKLKDAGIESVMDLAVTWSEDLSVDLNSSKESAAALIKAAQKLLRDSNLVQKEFVTADAALDRRSENNRSFIYYWN